MSFWPEFLIIASVHLLAVASPGPDFAIVLRYAVRYGRRAAVFASLGIGVAILLHVTYSLVGIGVLIKTTPWLFQLLTVLAACYLLYLAQGALRAKAPVGKDVIELERQATPASLKAFSAGFITNGLNPKATLFFLSLFAVVISAETPFSFKLIYGVYMALATAAWFCLLSFVLTNSKIRGFLLLKGYWFDRLMGVLLLLLAAQLLLSSFGGAKGG
ncbi:MAG: lysine transporter LysE [Rheinheimera sp.]|uniref:LysE family translocator n=1 Tax=Arsukibacterium sp. UBA3155 TaxID=1946058 RepID=UPI000C97A6F4|nr:LysE family translocator [Arsukibacterium sp. UBA3155]MAD76997.1 lysine transporter LysE [Rheinheimera sp.]|tara:strand:- start:20811 stop:21458 length:648 start_codon:yes stop_codon:yes gene_type:complete